MAIDAQHEQYKKYHKSWEEIKNIIDGENVEQYLPVLNPHDTGKKNELRNKTYRERAVFYELAGETVEAQNGMLFKKQPELEIPPELEYLKTNIDGRGNSIFQQSKRVTRNVNCISRDALFTSYPKTNGEVTKAEINKGLAVATIQQIEAKRVINWREQSFGSRIKLVLVVFSDTDEEIIDYELKKTDVLRELFLDTENSEKHVYRERKWKKNDKDEWIVDDEVLTPVDKNGHTFDEIQWDFIGGVNNDPDVDKPNQKAMTRLNKAHFINSADYEDNVYWIGQSQSWMSGITKTHLELMKVNGMYVGSRDMLGVPSGEKFGIESSPPNVLVRQAMLDKVDQMATLGAKQITIGGVAKTSNQTDKERGSEYSTLTLIADNVSEAYTSALARVEMFMIGSITGKSFYKINTDFIEPTASPAELKEMMTGYLTATVPALDYIRYMKKQQKFDESKSDDEYLEELNRTDMPDLGGE